jgi:hypothetical protein
MYREIKKVKTTGTSYERLPVLRSGKYRSFPRIYVVARKMVELSGGYLNEENITLMLKAYQKELPLADKELWALPEMVGLCLLESIIEVSEEIIRIIKIKDRADKFVKNRLEIRRDNIDITPLLHKAAGDCKANASFHSHVIYMLKNMSIGDDIIQKYISYYCKMEGKHLNPSEVFTEEGRLEARLESNIRTLIISLREINQVDEEKLFEELSLLEHILLKDPAEIYPTMDSESKGVYRAIIEKLAFQYNIPEGRVGQACLNLANQEKNKVYCSNHVGAYVVGKGYPILKAVARGKPEPRIDKKKINVKGVIYFITGAMILFLSYLMLLFIFNRLESSENILVISILLLVLAPILVGIAQEIANLLITSFVPVQKIPSLDYLNEIPDSARTFVVMPVIIAKKKMLF